MLYRFSVVEPPEDWEQVNPSQLRTLLSLRVDALPQESGSFDVTRDDSERRFLAQHRVLQSWNDIVIMRNNVATLCCAKNRRCESSRVITLATAIIKKQ